MDPAEILRLTDHRPWPLPARAWAGHMRWTNLAFLHWPVDPAVLRPLVPAPFPIDTFDGQAWVGVVPFRMEETRLHFTPAIPGLSEFAELNVRTYVRVGDRAGVWFFSLDAANPLAVRGARLLYNLPYFDAEMSIEPRGEGVEYRSERVHRDAPQARFRAVYEPTGTVYQAASGTLDHFLVERYCLFNLDRAGKAGFMDIHHLPWPLQPAIANIELNTMTLAAGIPLPDRAPVVHFARSLQVLVWTHREL